MKNCCPYSEHSGEIPVKIIKNQLYRQGDHGNNRAIPLKTYRKKLY